MRNPHRGVLADRIKRSDVQAGGSPVRVHFKPGLDFADDR